MSEPFARSTRDELVTLVREWLLCGHLIDRAGMPAVIGAAGAEVMTEVAIDEWMGASPIYTKRMQRCLGFEGDDVETIFKGMQLDIGAPPQFMDFRYSVHDAHHGEFHLAHCGALMDVEPMGEPFITAMCHHIEDPTFDATALATNPRAQVRPIHRPPRVPADRHPHCAWTVTIVPEAEPVVVSPVTERLAASVAATTALASPAERAAAWSGPIDGRLDYDGPLEADLDLDAFAPPALAAILDEVALQGHLLVLSFNAAVADRLDDASAHGIARAQAVGIVGLTADRLRAALGFPAEGSGLDGIAAVLAVHPALHPRTYVELTVEPEADGPALRVALRDGAWSTETVAIGWPALFAAHDDLLAVLVEEVDATARVERLVPDEPSGEVAAWRVSVGHAPAPERDEVLLTRFSTGAAFSFRSR